MTEGTGMTEGVQATFFAMSGGGLFPSFLRKGVSGSPSRERPGLRLLAVKHVRYSTVSRGRVGTVFVTGVGRSRTVARGGVPLAW